MLPLDAQPLDKFLLGPSHVGAIHALLERLGCRVNESRLAPGITTKIDGSDLQALLHNGMLLVFAPIVEDTRKPDAATTSGTLGWVLVGVIPGRAWTTATNANEPGSRMSGARR